MTKSNANIVAVAGTASFQFTEFDVQRVIRLEGEYGESFVQIDARQDESVMATIVGHSGIFDKTSGLHVIVNELGGEQFAMVVHQAHELYELAESCTDEGGTLPVGAYGGVVWQVHGHTSDKPAVPFTLLSGDDDGTVHDVCAALQSMIDIQNKVRAYNESLNDAEKSPDGDDYNAVLKLLRICSTAAYL